MIISITGIAQAGSGVFPPALSNNGLPGQIKASSTISGHDYDAGHVLIKFKPALRVSKSGIAGPLTASPAMNDLLQKEGVQAVKSVFTSHPSRLSPKSIPLNSNGLDRWYRAELAAGYDPLTVASHLQSVGEIEWAEIDAWVRLCDDAPANEIPAAVKRTSRASDASSEVIKDKDPLISLQWHLEAIRAREAWAHLKSLGIPEGGSREVVVAVIDTGVQYTHPDLAANIWTNSREIAGNGLDDDANGFVDDVHGANVGGTHSGDPMDDAGHGTHVAGIIAAQSGNYRDGAGVAPNVLIMPVKANIKGTGRFAVSDEAEAVQYAVSHGADVINLSLGGYAESKLITEVMEMASKSVVIVASAGNDYKPNRPHPQGENMYPASYPFVIGVMASDQEGKKVDFSNWDYIPYDGNDYEVMAPGSGIWSTYPSNQFRSMNGTSMASPVVAGIAALLRSKYSDRTLYPPEFIHGQIVGTSIQSGNWKRVDAYQAIAGIPQPLIKTIEQRFFDSISLSLANDGDGIVDAGETINVAVAIRNYAANADRVSAQLDAVDGLGAKDPYVTILIPTVDFGPVGAQSTDDNGLIRETDGSITGVRSPFRFAVSPDCPNEHTILFQMSLNYHSASEKNGSSSIWSTNNFTVRVLNGTELPRIILTDMTLTKDRLYIVPTTTLIPYGVTVNVTPGTRIQCGIDKTSKADRGFLVEGTLNVEGSASEPAVLYPLNNSAKTSLVISGSYGKIKLIYASVYSPTGYATSADHCYFGQTIPDNGYSGGGLPFACPRIQNSIFDRIGIPTNYKLNVYSTACLNNNLFDSCLFSLAGISQSINTGNTFLKGYQKGYKLNDLYFDVSSLAGFKTLNTNDWGQPVFPTNVVINGEAKTYFAISKMFANCPVNETYPYQYDAFAVAEAYARACGGHLVDITSAEENSFISNYVQSVNMVRFNQLYPSRASDWDIHYSGNLTIGLYDKDQNGKYTWISGEPISFTNWAPGAGTGKIAYGFYWTSFSSNGWTNRANGGPFLVELPGLFSQRQLDTNHIDACATIVKAKEKFRQNAILNVWWDDKLWPSYIFGNGSRRWMRLIGNSTDRNLVSFIAENYWGTTSRTLIDAAIFDANDNINYGPLYYEPILTTPPTNCYPFVTDIILSTAKEDSADTVGPELVTFRVVFNRDMDTRIQPTVTFGPIEPFTDFKIDGDWQDPRVWKGQFRVTPLTGDGYQLLSVSGAVAADDPWLVTGRDSERFRFLIRSAGTESMNLQAVGADNGVRLSWIQDDFELLAGYHLYRSLNSSNDFVRINAFLIPTGQKSFLDTQTVPGKRYYYKFTVVKTDLAESDFSNIAEAVPSEAIPPVMSHTVVTQIPLGAPLTVSAEIVDNNRVEDASLYWRVSGTDKFNRASMLHTEGNWFAASIPASQVVLPGIEYCIEASDGSNSTWSGQLDSPHFVAVVEQPVILSILPSKGASAGGTTVTITGANFKPGMVASFGGIPGTGMTLANDHQATVATPAHFPAVVDVSVENPEGQRTVCLKGYQFLSDLLTLSIPQIRLKPGIPTTVTLSSTYVSGLASADLAVSYDPTQLQILSVRLGSLLSGWALAVNTNQSGRIRMSLASPGLPLTGEGAWVELICQAIATTGANSVFALDSAVVNGGAIATQTAVGPPPATYHITGTVQFWNGNRVVPRVHLTLTGDGNTTVTNDASGAYDLGNIYSGVYHLQAAKSDQVQGISSYDAALVLQHAVGLIQLTGHAATAADVDKNGLINSMDAFYILQKTVGLMDVPFPGAGRVWDFAPASTALNVDGNLSAQNFTAILLGDVSGNWDGATAARLAPFGLNPYQALEKAVVLAICRVPETKMVKVLYRTSIPIHSLDFQIRGIETLRAGSRNIMLAANRRTDGVLQGGLAGINPLAGVGELFSGVLPEGSEALPLWIQAIADESAVPVKVELGPGSFLADTDQDGQSDWNEILAGTNPAESGSVFKVVGVESLNAGRKVIWTSIAGRQYQLESLDMGDGNNWKPVGQPITATGLEASATDGPGLGQLRFYRVRLMTSGFDLNMD